MPLQTNTPTDPVDGPRDPAGRPSHTDDGADLTLIRWSLSRTPLERLRALEDRIRFVHWVRASGD